MVQLDTQTLPLGLVPVACGNRFAERAYSQFVEPQAGALWRTDFVLAPAPHGRGLHQQLIVKPAGGEQQIELRVSVDGAALENVSAVVMLPDGLARQLPA